MGVQHMIQRRHLGAALCAAAIVGLSSPAIAGEVTGNGDPTGMRDHARSECGFSGLEDHPDAPTSPPPGTPEQAAEKRRLTQTPHLVWFDLDPDPANHFWLEPPPGTPGQACSPGRPASP